MLVIWGRGYAASKAASPLGVWRRWADDAQEPALGCGHFVTKEQPEAVARALGEFFRNAGVPRRDQYGSSRSGG